MALSLCAIVLLSPLMLVIALLVRINLGSPVIFKQQRPGLNEKTFTLYKFRTMTDERDQDGQLLPDTQRLTRFGQLLRSTSLDELPELFNVLLGEMSLVGPRPLVARYLPYYTDSERRRHSVRPGVTGLAQVNGRNSVNWEQRFQYDLWYVENLSLSLDLVIVVKTVGKVIRRSDIGVAGAYELEDFDQYRMRETSRVTQQSGPQDVSSRRGILKETTADEAGV